MSGNRNRSEPELRLGWEPDGRGGQRRRVTVAEAEGEHMVQNEQLGPDPVPFGFQNERWRHLLDQMRAGDELWEFTSSPETWRRLAGRAGFVLVRDGEVIADMITRMS